MQKLLTVKQAADLLALCPSMVYQLIDRGDLPAIRFGTAIRISPDALEARVRELAGGPRESPQ